MTSTTTRQQAVLSLLAGEWVESDTGDRTSRGDTREGLTWRELAEAMGWHHGQASGALSGLHRQGLVARLGSGYKRSHCSAYVLPEYVNGRDTVPYGRHPLDPAYAQEVTRRVQAEGRVTRAVALLDEVESVLDVRPATFATELRKVLTNG